MFDFTSILKYAPFLLQGAGLTLLVSIASLCIGMCLGLIVALLRMSTISPIKFAAGLYIDIFRSTPLLAQLMWIFFALPIVTGITLSPFYTGTIGLGLYSGSYLAEVYRSGILAIPQGQWHASRAIGMNTAQLLRRIILPQAVWRVLPGAPEQEVGFGFAERILRRMPAAKFETSEDCAQQVFVIVRL